MVFSSAIFLLLFLPVVFVFNWFVKKEFSNYFFITCKFVLLCMGRTSFSYTHDGVNRNKLDSRKIN